MNNISLFATLSSTNEFNTKLVDLIMITLPIPVAARSKVWSCDRYIAGIPGSNPAGGMDVCFLS
jgi:hypothetical protein